MDTEKTPSVDVEVTAESKDGVEVFTKVKSKKSQKRKREQDGVDMDTESVAIKRPQFPPISGEKLRVITIFLRFVCHWDVRKRTHFWYFCDMSSLTRFLCVSRSRSYFAHAHIVIEPY